MAPAIKKDRPPALGGGPTFTYLVLTATQIWDPYYRLGVLWLNPEETPFGAPLMGPLCVWRKGRVNLPYLYGRFNLIDLCQFCQLDSRGLFLPSSLP